MKNSIIKSIFLSMVIGGMTTITSCEKYLEVENPSNLSQEAVFNSVSYANSSVVGIYNKLIGDNGYGNRISCLYPQSADDFRTSGDYSPNDRRGLSSYGAANTNPELNKPFIQLYEGIERANICIKFIPASALYTNGSEADKKALRKLYGEALTLRAQFYYELIRNWGDVPASFEPSADAKDLFQAKTDRDVIYDKILEDLKVASELVPWRTESSEQNLRLTKGAVKGLRARIALARGGYSLRTESNKMERRSDYLTFYKIAYDECKAIIERRDQHDLNPSFENLFKTLHTGARLDPTNEWMFEVGAFGGNSKTDSKLGYYNGLRLDNNSKFGGGGGGITAIPTYFYEFDKIGDSRRDITLTYFEIDKDSKKVMRASIDMNDGKFRRSWTSVTGTSQNLAINWPILRFADVLLMFAEADNEINGSPSEAAKNALLEIRKRAYAGYPNRVGGVPTDKEGFFQAIVKERLLEFGGEGIRKYDLIRWNLLASKIDETRAKLVEFKNGTGAYAGIPDVIYTKPAEFKNVAVPEEVSTLDTYGGANAFYEPAPTSAPTGYTSKNWRKGVDDEYISGDRKGFARYFEANKKELFPFHIDVLNQNYKLTQNFGY